MDAFKTHHHKTKETFTVCDEKGKDIKVDVFQYEDAHVYMPLVFQAFNELQDKIISLEKKIKILETNVSSFVPPPPPEEPSSRVKKPINLKF